MVAPLRADRYKPRPRPETQEATLARFAGFILDNYGAPQLSALTHCGAPEMPEPVNYVGTFVLNSIFNIAFADPLKRLIIMACRRTENAVNEYRRGREVLVSYIDRLPAGNNHFLVALRAATHFEQCVGSASQALALVKRIVDLIGTPGSTPVWDDRATRMKKIWNRAKHFDEDIGPGKRATADITAPVWLINDGLCSQTACLTFQELHDILTDLQDTMKHLAHDLPAQAIAERTGGPSTP